MPGGDRTGPRGLGPRTGRAMGYCSGYNMPGYTNPVYGRGFGRGWGRGFGRGFWGRGRGLGWRGFYSHPAPYYPETYFPEPTNEEERVYLEDIIKGLEEEIKMIRGRLRELSKEKKDASK